MLLLQIKCCNWGGKIIEINKIVNNNNQKNKLQIIKQHFHINYM